MLISEFYALRIVGLLPASDGDLNATDELWRRYDACVLALRQPLYFRRLGKKKPKPAVCFAATKDALRLVAAFAHAYSVRQVIISSLSTGVADTISMQTRIHGFNWSARHGLSWGTNAVLAADAPAMCVGIDDMMHLAAKAVHLIIDCEPLRLPPLTATFDFSVLPEIGEAFVVVHEHAGRRRTYAHTSL